MSFDDELSDLGVLVIDDDRMSRSLVSGLFEELGATDVQVAANALEGFEVLRRFSPDLIICDLVMEKMSGLAFARRIRTHPGSPNPYVPIILLTAQADRKAVMDARDAGINAFLAKPVSYDSLRAKVISVMEDPREFIRTDAYVGPDRRNRSLPLNGRTDRRRTRN